MSTLRVSAVMFVVLSLLTGLIYPLGITAMSAPAFTPALHLVGQQFTQAGYFWSRPSATTPPYNAAASAATNFGPLNPALIEQVSARARALDLTAGPSDLLMASASGLDPHLSPAAALAQVPRVAAARRLTASALEALVKTHVEERLFGIFGEPRVNVVALNLALDALPH